MRHSTTDVQGTFFVVDAWVHNGMLNACVDTFGIRYPLLRGRDAWVHEQMNGQAWVRIKRGGGITDNCSIGPYRSEAVHSKWNSPTKVPWCISFSSLALTEFELENYTGLSTEACTTDSITDIFLQLRDAYGWWTVTQCYSRPVNWALPRSEQVMHTVGERKTQRPSGPSNWALSVSIRERRVQKWYMTSYVEKHQERRFSYPRAMGQFSFLWRIFNLFSGRKTWDTAASVVRNTAIFHLQLCEWKWNEDIRHQLH